MALHRLPQLVTNLTGIQQRPDDTEAADPVPNKTPWPINTPCTIVERASCRDQRVIRSTLEHVCAAVEELGSRPPGLLVLGRACGALRSLEGKWCVEEGFDGLQGVEGFPAGDLLVDRS